MNGQDKERNKAMTVVETESPTAPRRQEPPNGNGEHKPLSDKELEPARQLATDSTSDEDPVAREAAAMLASPDLPQQIIDDVHSLGVVGEDDLLLMVYVTATARLMPRAIHLCAHGESASGKSYTVSRVLDLFPPEAVLRATQITPKHLLNLSEEDVEQYKHRVIFIGEQIDEELGLAFREMAESGEVHNLTVREGRSQVSVARGPVTFIATTTLCPSQMKDEDASRMFYYATDDTAEQTLRVMSARADRSKGSVRRVNKASIVRKHRVAQENLARHADVVVVVPYAHLIDLPPESPHSRRLHDRILLLLEAVVFLGQFRSGRQRKPDDSGTVRIYADAEDWRIALPLIEAIVAQKFGLPDPATRKFMEHVRALGKGPFSIDDLVQRIGSPETTVRRRINGLPNGSRKIVTDGRKHLYSFSFEDNPLRAAGLPSYDDVQAHLRDGGKLENSAK